MTSTRLTIAILGSAITLLAGGALFVARGDSAPASSAAPISTPPDEILTYVDREYGFTFQYPSSATVYPYWDDAVYVLSVPRVETKEGFTLLITPFDEPGPLTSERILEDLPVPHPVSWTLSKP